MKVRLPALLLALALTAALPLTGCSAMLSRDYQVVSPHPEHPLVEGDSSALRVETYQELVNAVLYFVEQGVEHGVVRLVNYTRDVEADLTRACLEVAKDDPLGAYAVDFIKHECTRVVTTYEANIYITYRRTLEQTRALVNVTGSGAIRQELAEALERFAPEVALRVGYFAEDEDYIRSLVRQAYYDTPAAALGMPACTVSLYPETGRQRIVEILLDYPEDAETLNARRTAALEAARRLSASAQEADPEAKLRSLAGALALLAVYDPEAGGGTVWDALVMGRADSEGLALALGLLGGQAGVDCAVMEGTLDGAPHFWNVLELDSGEPRYLDLSGEDPAQLCSAEVWRELGYRWGAEESPAPEDTEVLPEDVSTVMHAGKAAELPDGVQAEETVSPEGEMPAPDTPEAGAEEPEAAPAQ